MSAGGVVLMFMLSLSVSHAGWFESIKSATYCKFTECCNTFYIPYKLADLKYTLESELFGQPLAMNVINILRAHKESIDNNKLNKAEVMSFHGWTGVGKNYLANMIAESLYYKGLDSQYVLMFQGQKAIDAGNLDASREKLLNEIEATVRKCPTSLIIFDEVDEMDPKILEKIKYMLDHNKQINGVDYRKSLFIFISNIAGEEITNELLQLYDQGVKREDLDFRDFESIIRKTCYFHGGFSKSSIISKNLIDHYIPFLPLEQSHVEQCAMALFSSHDVVPTPEMWQDALSVITYGPTEDKPIFSNSGCKRLPKHIPYVIHKHSWFKNEL